MQDMMIPARIFFSKTGRARYTSHLDTMRTITRALKRSRLPIWHTQGFNPHPYLSFALPIALGYESRCESMDIRLVEELPLEEAARRLDDVLPPGFSVERAAPPQMDPGDIFWGDYEITLVGTQQPDKALKALRAFVATEEILVLKKTKKGEREVDIRPLLELLDARVEGQDVQMLLRLRSGNTVNINPTLFLSAFADTTGVRPSAARVLRTAIRTEGLEEFR